VNRAHFAGLVTIVVTLGLALMLARAEVPASRPGRVDFRSRVRRWMGPETGASRLLPFLILVMGGAILIAGSRGGIVGLLGALVCVGVLSRWRRQPDHRAPALMGIGVAVGLTGMWMGSEIFLGTIGRFTAEISDPESSLRILRWRDVADLVARAPLVGTGLASFEMAFPVVRTIAYRTRFTHAESDWVQLLADTGLVGVGLVVAMVGAICVEGFRCIRRAESAERRALCVGGLAALAASALQSVPNYTIPMMANHLYLATAIALTIRRER
jgi:O-antigen ligase